MVCGWPVWRHLTVHVYSFFILQISTQGIVALESFTEGLNPQNFPLPSEHGAFFGPYWTAMERPLSASLCYYIYNQPSTISKIEAKILPYTRSFDADFNPTWVISIHWTGMKALNPKPKNADVSLTILLVSP